MKGDLTSGNSGASARMDAARAEISKEPVAPVTQEAPPAAVETAPPPAPVEDIDVPDSSFFTKHKAKQEPKAKEEPKVEAPAKPAETAQQPSSQTLRKIKANGKEVDIDFGDTEALEKHVAMSLGARKAFAERDKYKKELEAKVKEAEENRKYREAMEKFEALRKDPDQFAKTVFGKTLDEIAKERQAQAEWIANATPAEKEAFELKQRIAQTESEALKKVKDLEERLAKYDADRQETEVKSMHAKLLSEFSKVKFDDPKDPHLTAELNKMLYQTVVRNLSDIVENSEDTIEDLDPVIVSKEFDRVAKLLKRTSAKMADEQLSAIDKERAENAKKQAQAASTASYSQGMEDAELMKYAARPTELFKRFFRK